MYFCLKAICCMRGNESITFFSPHYIKAKVYLCNSQLTGSACQIVRSIKCLQQAHCHCCCLIHPGVPYLCCLCSQYSAKIICKYLFHIHVYNNFDKHIHRFFSLLSISNTFKSTNKIFV